jgi:hypothetical protein
VRTHHPHACADEHLSASARNTPSCLRPCAASRLPCRRRCTLVSRTITGRVFRLHLCPACGVLGAPLGLVGRHFLATRAVPLCLCSLHLAPLLPCADPFADEAAAAAEEEAEDAQNVTTAKGKAYVHVRVQQRNGRKSLTTVQVRGSLARVCACVRGTQSLCAVCFSDRLYDSVFFLLRGCRASTPPSTTRRCSRRSRRSSAATAVWWRTPSTGR